MKFEQWAEGMDEGYIRFVCPGCKDIHAIPTKGYRGWKWNGDLAQPTIEPSILSRHPKGDNFTMICHSFVRGGHIEFLNDSTHELAGKTVELPELPEGGCFP